MPATDERRVIRCDTPGTRQGETCGQILARMGERGDCYPVVVGAYTDCDGRLTVTCPSCEQRKRLPARRIAC